MNKIIMSLVDFSTFCKVSPVAMRMYLSHFSLIPYMTTATDSLGRRCRGVEITESFVNDFISYLNVLQGRKLAKKIIMRLQSLDLTLKGNL